MKHFVRIFVATALCLVLRVSGNAQQDAPRSPQEAAQPQAELTVEQIRQIASPIQRLIAVDRLVEDKEYDEAVQAYKDMLASDPQNAQIWNRLGNTYQALQQTEEAVRAYKQALKVDKHFAAAVNNMGCIYYNQRRYGKAGKEFRKAVKMDSSVASFHSNLGYSYLAEKKYKPMMEAFHAAVTLDPTIFDQHNRSGSIVLERSVQDRGAFYFFLAKTYGQVGDADRCLLYLTKARDEHYKDILSVKTDPAFAPVRPKPAVREFIDGLTPPNGPNPSSAAE
ncbi:MAG TPA: tetratricopeptide repeat protein [Patescibacteria group bacterium]|nr:tetratricopeptide repeat protein [Patescibacteria group bacterium]